MYEETHSFVTGPLWLKLKEDAAGMRILSAADFCAAAYFHVRRLMLTRAGWSGHLPDPVGHGTLKPAPELVLLFRGEFQVLLRFEFALQPGRKAEFPAARLSEELAGLRSRLADWEQNRPGASYLFGLFDSEEAWFFPDEAMWEKQSCFWVPVNAREFPGYPDWRARFDKLVLAPGGRKPGSA